MLVDPVGTSREALDPLRLHVSEPHACPYLPGRTAVDLFTFVHDLPPGTHQRFMDAGFRRSGSIVYRPTCPACRECVPIRVPVDRFVPSRSQRRVLNRNRDVRVEIAAPCLTDEKWRVYSDYVAVHHRSPADQDRSDFERFLYESPTTTIEMAYRADDRIVGVGIVDACPTALSSVYFYFAPSAARRSLGVFSGLREIEVCRGWGLPYWYVGFYVRACRRMNYKARFRPHEFLDPDGVWRDPIAAASTPPATLRAGD